MRELLYFIIYLAIFLAGMAILRIGLFNVSGDKLKRFLKRVTHTPVRGFFVGIIITGILQSSSAVMVMTIGLVSTGSLNFTQTIGIILGTNIGSTFTTEFMTIPLERWTVPGAVFGAILWLVPHILAKSAGTSLIGLSCVIAAINGFKKLAEPISSFDSVQHLLTSMESNLFIALFTGMAVTAIIHSSSAMTGIAMGFLAAGEMSVPAGIAIMLGSNIGTCVTAYMASLGAGKEARFTSYAHIWLNLIGVAIFFPFISSLEKLAALFTVQKDVQLAHASVIFNILSSLIALPFTEKFTKFIMFIHNRKSK
ncbi:phosphate:Na+ symporter [Peribacillus deserti]|uniref:Phosphate:Na+ symporter n=1 Tax=Peribacillus deserti TaxID=673318 RepID=A0ABS2QFA1_9BACI|nr:Na/Pi symporter [Peribacillus deserti]MBM7691813.1 phosphate:Na+ symporter [Peribacillus deserti]